MTNNILKLIAGVTIATISTTASAVNVEFSINSFYPPVYPIYPIYYPQPIYYAQPIRPCVGVHIGSSEFGFNIDIPLEAPRPARTPRPRRVATPHPTQCFMPSKTDNTGKNYWRFFNDTDTEVIVMNKNHEYITIQPGTSKILRRLDSYQFVVKAHGQRIKSRSNRHHVTIEFDEFDDISIIEE